MNDQLAFFERLSQTWDELNPMERVVPQLLDELACWKIEPDETILDVGCGTGNMTAALLKLLGPEGRVIALDSSEGMLRRARAKVSDQRVTWLQAGAEATTLAADCCDRLICYSVWPHFEDTAAVLREFRRILASGGSIHLLHLISRAAVNEIHGTADHSVHHHLFLPVEQVSALFQEADFKVEQAVEDDTSYRLTARK